MYYCKNNILLEYPWLVGLNWTERVRICEFKVTESVAGIDDEQASLLVWRV